MNKYKCNKYSGLLILLIIALSCYFCHDSYAKGISGYLILEDSVLAPGVVYRNVLIGKGRYKHSVHVLEADLINPFISTAVLKAHSHVNELEKMHAMIRKYDSTHPESKALGAVNANFWRAYSNRPIGPTIIDGELLEMMTHKKWTSAFFNNISLMFIDTFFIEGTIRLKTGDTLNIKRVNRRHDSLGVVVYNKFGGDTIPFIHAKALAKAFTAALQDTIYNDSTDIVLDTIGLMKTIKLEQRRSSYENPLTKILVSYLDEPAINRNIKCKVNAVVDSGCVLMPDNGAVISLGDDIEESLIPGMGDTIVLRYSTNLYDSVEFFNAISGTPRLVRDGKAKHEAREEGSKGRRFINKALARTAIGTNKERTKIYFAAVESGSKWKRTRGANLTNMASIMKKLGCYNAMNLDGGSSTMMVVDNKNLLRSNPSYSKNISVGLAIIQKIFKEQKK
ncbi:phosphodiester glycosidase family protein [Bacteroidota bacterium]